MVSVRGHGDMVLHDVGSLDNLYLWLFAMYRVDGAPLHFRCLSCRVNIYFAVRTFVRSQQRGHPCHYVSEVDHNCIL
jgi:hypothetical protein